MRLTDKLFRAGLSYRRGFHRDCFFIAPALGRFLTTPLLPSVMTVAERRLIRRRASGFNHFANTDFLGL